MTRPERLQPTEISEKARSDNRLHQAINKLLIGLERATAHPTNPDDLRGIAAMRHAGKETREFLSEYRDLVINILRSKEAQALLRTLDNAATNSTTLDVQIQDTLNAFARELETTDRSALGAFLTTLPKGAAKAAEANLKRWIDKSHPESLSKIAQYQQTGVDNLSASELAFAQALEYLRGIQQEGRVVPDVNQATSLGVLPIIFAVKKYDKLPASKKSGVVMAVLAGVTGCQMVDQNVEPPVPAEVIDVEDVIGEPTAIAPEPTTTTEFSVTPSELPTETPIVGEQASLYHQQLVIEGIIAEGAQVEEAIGADGVTYFIRILQDSEYGSAGTIITPGIDGHLFASPEGANHTQLNVEWIDVDEHGRVVGYDSGGNIVVVAGNPVFDEEREIYVSDWEVVEALTPTQEPTPTAPATEGQGNEEAPQEQEDAEVKEVEPLVEITHYENPANLVEAMTNNTWQVEEDGRSSPNIDVFVSDTEFWHDESIPRWTKLHNTDVLNEVMAITDPKVLENLSAEQRAALPEGTTGGIFALNIHTGEPFETVIYPTNAETKYHYILEVIPGLTTSSIVDLSEYGYTPEGQNEDVQLRLILKTGPDLREGAFADPDTNTVFIFYRIPGNQGLGESAEWNTARQLRTGYFYPNIESLFGFSTLTPEQLLEAYRKPAAAHALSGTLGEMWDEARERVYYPRAFDTHTPMTFEFEYEKTGEVVKTPLP